MASPKNKIVKGKFLNHDFSFTTSLLGIRQYYNALLFLKVQKGLRGEFSVHKMG